MLGVARKLCTLFKAPQMAARDFLQQFLLEVGRLSAMLSSMVWKLLYFGQQTPFPHRLRAEKSRWKRGKQGGEDRDGKTVEKQTKKAK